MTFPPVALFVTTLLKRLSISFGTVHLQRNVGKIISLGVTFIMIVFCFGRTQYWVLLSMNNLKGNASDLVLAKFHIHRCKYPNSRPHFFVFMKEFEQYLSLIQLSKNKKTLKTLSTCNSFPTFNDT